MSSEAQNLLDSPAVILGEGVLPDTHIFAPEGAVRPPLLVTANPDYIKKDRPAYVPRFIVVTWSWDEGDTSLIGGIHGARFRRIFETDFPIEELQAMIDK